MWNVKVHGCSGILPTGSTDSAGLSAHHRTGNLGTPPNSEVPERWPTTIDHAIHPPILHCALESTPAAALAAGSGSAVCACNPDWIIHDGSHACWRGSHDGRRWSRRALVRRLRGARFHRCVHHIRARMRLHELVRLVAGACGPPDPHIDSQCRAHLHRCAVIDACRAGAETRAAASASLGCRSKCAPRCRCGGSSEWQAFSRRGERISERLARHA